MTEVEDSNTLFPSEGTKMVNETRVKLSYTRDFLLSFSAMDVCKKPPNGFDSSFLSDCQEVLQCAPEWRRAYGTSSIQSFKRGENGLQTTTWVESTSHGVQVRSLCQGSGSSSHGKWENRPGSGDESGDQESEDGSVSQDSSRQFGRQPQQLGQSPERDGLLGSGGFPRPSVHAGGPLRVQRNGGKHPSRDTDRYQPPWMNKPSYQARRDATDTCNDETFGFSERPSQDKADEERRRRACFEMMRKEQQKALQDKLKQAPNKQNTDLLSLDISEDEMSQKSDNGVDGHVVLQQTDNVKSSLPQASAARPIVPPGFASARLDKNLSAKAPMRSESEHDKSITIEWCQSTNASMLTNDTVVDQMKEKYLAADAAANGEPLKVEGAGAQPVNGIEKPMTTLLDPTDDLITELAPGKRIVKKSDVPEGNSKSILEKLFGGVIKANTAGLAAITETSVAKLDEEPPASSRQSSKFACWFGEEVTEANSSLDQHPSKAEGLLSLFVNTEKGTSHGQKNAATTFPTEVGNVQEFRQPSVKSASSTVCDGLQLDKLDSRSGVLTCEDLEQFILSEANASQTIVAPPTKESAAAYDSVTTHQKTDIDNRASQHLLSLLQMGRRLNEPTPSTKAEDAMAVHGPLHVSGDGSQLPQKTLTLKTLFGAAFMQELQSVEAPVSVQRFSGTKSISSADEVSDIHLGSAGFDELMSAKTEGSHDRHGVSSSIFFNGLNTRTDTTGTSWGDLDGSNENNRRNVAQGFQFEAGPADDIVPDIRLPEEDSLISIVNPPPSDASKFLLSGITSKESSLPDGIIDKFARLNTHKGDSIAMPRANHQALQEILGGPFDLSGPEIQYQQHLFGGQPLHNLNMNPSKPTLPPPYLQLEQDANGNLEKFMGLRPNNSAPDLRHHFAPSVLPHHLHRGAGIPPRLDVPPHLAIQHTMPSNFPGPHPLAAPFPAGMLPQHLPGMGVFNNPMAALMPEFHSIQGPSFLQRPPHFNPIEMPIPGSGVRSGHPEGLERFIEMELRANANKKPPFVHNPGPLGPELDMGYRYR